MGLIFHNSPCDSQIGTRVMTLQVVLFGVFLILSMPLSGSPLLLPAHVACDLLHGKLSHLLNEQNYIPYLTTDKCHLCSVCKQVSINFRKLASFEFASRQLPATLVLPH